MSDVKKPKSFKRRVWLPQPPYAYSNEWMSTDFLVEEYVDDEGEHWSCSLLGSLVLGDGRNTVRLQVDVSNKQEFERTLSKLQKIGEACDNLEIALVDGYAYKESKEGK